MKNSILFFFLLLGQFSYGQNCQYEVNEVDKFTKQKNIITKFEDFATGIYKSNETSSKINNISISLQNADNKVRLLIKCKFARDVSSFYYANVDAIIILKNDSTIKLTGLYGEKYTFYGYGNKVEATFYFDLPLEAIENLKGSDVTDIRLLGTFPKTTFRPNESTDKIDFKPDLDKGLIIKKQLQCIE